MTSINTNTSTMTALQTLRASTKSLGKLQSETATGFRIAEASHNAAYWSISVGMRSQVGATSAVRDSLGLAAAKVDVAYSAMTQVEGILSSIKERLVLAQQDGVDLGKIQQEISQLAQQAITAANSASFGGANLLVTSVEDLWEGDLADRSVQLVSSYSKTADGPKFGTIGVDLRGVSLLNDTGGGILQADPRSPRSIGGIRNFSEFNGLQYLGSGIYRSGAVEHISLTFDGPFTLAVGESLSFDITVNEDNPAHGLPGPLDPGRTTTVTISRSDIDYLFPNANGEVADFEKMHALLSEALAGTGADVSFVWKREPYNKWVIIENALRIIGSEDPAKYGSSVRISAVSSPSGTGGVVSSVAWGTRNSSILPIFEPFKIYEDVVVTMEFHVSGMTPLEVTLDRATVDSVLGVADGRVNTVTEMVTLLEHLVGQPGLLIEEDGHRIRMRTETTHDRYAGTKSELGFRDVIVSIEPIPSFDLDEIDIETYPEYRKAYLAGVDSMHSRLVAGASYLGAIKTNIESQDRFASQLMDAIERGIGQLVDADMGKTAARLRAEEVRQQLAMQALSISNNRPQAILQLFQQ